MTDGIRGAEGPQPSQQELATTPPQHPEKAPLGPAEAVIAGKIVVLHDNPDRALHAIAGTPPEQPPTAADSTVQGEKKRRAGFTSPDLEPPITAGASQPSQERPVIDARPSALPETNQPEAAGQQKTEWSEEDIEFLAPARKEFQENVKQLDQNLAGLGNSGVEPEQGGKATQEKWGRLKAFFKSDAGKNLAFLTGVGLSATGLGLVIGAPLMASLAGAGLGVGIIYSVGKIGDGIEHIAASKGWEKIKGIFTKGGNQENKPK